MVESDFYGVEGTKAVGTSGDHRDFVIETLHSALGSSPLARNQLSISSSWERSIRATFFIGSRRLPMARKHQ